MNTDFSTTSSQVFSYQKKLTDLLYEYKNFKDLGDMADFSSDASFDEIINLIYSYNHIVNGVLGQTEKYIIEKRENTEIKSSLRNTIDKLTTENKQLKLSLRKILKQLLKEREDNLVIENKCSKCKNDLLLNPRFSSSLFSERLKSTNSPRLLKKNVNLNINSLISSQRTHEKRSLSENESIKSPNSNLMINILYNKSSNSNYHETLENKKSETNTRCKVKGNRDVKTNKSSENFYSLNTINHINTLNYENLTKMKICSPTQRYVDTYVNENKEGISLSLELTPKKSLTILEEEPEGASQIFAGHNIVKNSNSKNIKIYDDTIASSYNQTQKLQLKELNIQSPMISSKYSNIYKLDLPMQKQINKFPPKIEVTKNAEDTFKYQSLDKGSTMNPNDNKFKISDICGLEKSSASFEKKTNQINDKLSTSNLFTNQSNNNLNTEEQILNQINTIELENKNKKAVLIRDDSSNANNLYENPCYNQYISQKPLSGKPNEESGNRRTLERSSSNFQKSGDFFNIVNKDYLDFKETLDKQQIPSSRLCSANKTLQKSNSISSSRQTPQKQQKIRFTKMPQYQTDKIEKTEKKLKLNNYLPDSIKSPQGSKNFPNSKNSNVTSTNTNLSRKVKKITYEYSNEANIDCASYIKFNINNLEPTYYSKKHMVGGNNFNRGKEEAKNSSNLKVSSLSKINSDSKKVKTHNFFNTTLKKPFNLTQNTFFVPSIKP